MAGIVPSPKAGMDLPFKVAGLPQTERYLELDRNRRYWECSQHDGKRYDWNARLRRAGPPNTQLLISTESAPFYVPLLDRRPCAPVRLGKSIVEGFTNLVFGEERWPTILCKLDQETQEFAQALAEKQDLRTKMVEARNLGGAVGSVGLSWCFAAGVPLVESHDAKDVWVLEWADRRRLVPAAVSEIYRYPLDEWDPEKRAIVRNWYWYRHDWDRDREVCFLPSLHRYGREPEWVVDEETSVDHGFGFCPFVWVQNVPSSQTVDGKPDYDGLYDQMDNLDVTASVLARGVNLNLDPTLVLKVDGMVGQKMGVRKGSDNALWVGNNGDAKYLELAGTGVQAGLAVKESERKDILETAQCVLPDPNEIAAAGVSSIALKAIYQPMLGKAGILRSQYGNALKLLLEQQARVARERVGTKVYVPKDVGEGGEEPSGGEEPDVEEKDWTLDLPPKVRKEPKLGEDGLETGEFDEVEEEHDPGEGEELTLAWGDWFPRTSQDRSQDLTALSTAVAGKAILSQQTAAEEAAKALGRDPSEEWKRVKATADAEAKAQAEMFQGAAGPQFGEDPAAGDGDDEDKDGGGKPFGGGKRPGQFGGGAPNRAPGFQGPKKPFPAK